MMEDKECSTAEDFLHTLLNMQIKNPNGAIIYRGQDNAEWGLIPTAMRKGSEVDDFVRGNERYFTSAELKKASEDHKKLHSLILKLTSSNVYERWLVWKYVRDLSLKGDPGRFPLPSDRNTIDKRADFRLAPEIQKQFELYMNWYRTGGDTNRWEVIQNPLWYAEDIYHAMARHHGKDSRLIDFTYDPFYAAWFATGNKYTVNGEYIAVWAIRLFNIESTCIKLVEHIHYRHQIRFLHRQKGIFLFDACADINLLENGEWQGIEKSLLAEDISKITLSRSQVPKLIGYLENMGITKGFLQHSEDNIAQDIKPRMLL